MQKLVSKPSNIGSDNSLWPGRHQTINWTDAGTLLNGNLGTKYCDIWIQIHIFSFTKMHLKPPSEKWLPFRFGLNVLIKVNRSSWYIFDTSYIAHPTHKDLLTHWGPDKMAVVSWRHFQMHFLQWKWLKIHWSLFLRFELTIFQQWFR